MLFPERLLQFCGLPDGHLHRGTQSLLDGRSMGIFRIEALWKKVFTAQVSRLDTQGDLGNLANLNLKAYQAWIKFRDEKP